MNTLCKAFISISAILTLSGCLYGQCIDGPCALERDRMIKSIKPYGAHWIKEGMTRESRRHDLKDCGSTGDENIRFSEDQLKHSYLPGDPNEINAYLRLRDQLGECMKLRGYQSIGDLKHLGGCDARCLYP